MINAINNIETNNSTFINFKCLLQLSELFTTENNNVTTTLLKIDYNIQYIQCKGL